jgi:hypothetical protein
MIPVSITKFRSMYTPHHHYYCHYTSLKKFSLDWTVLYFIYVAGGEEKCTSKTRDVACSAPS